MILNAWNKIKLICGNHEDCDHEMTLKAHDAKREGNFFYSCSDYQKTYGDGNAGRTCQNEVSIKEFERLIDKLGSLSNDDPEWEDLTGIKWTDRGIQYEIIEHDKYRYVIKARNKKKCKS